MASRSTPETAGGSSGQARVGGEEGESAPTVCTNCQTTITPLWRRDPEGQPLCMLRAYRCVLRIADQLRRMQAMRVVYSTYVVLCCLRSVIASADVVVQKLHGVVRPLSLKTDVIKKRWVLFSVLNTVLFEANAVAWQESGVGHSPRFVEEEQLQLAEDRRAEPTPSFDDELHAVKYATISRGQGWCDNLCVDEAAKTDFHECSNTVVFVERRRWGLEHDVYCCCRLWCIILLLLHVLSNIHSCL